MQLTTVLFDLGGVLTPDPYETILLHEEKGIGRNLDMSVSEVVSRVSHVWEKYSVLPGAQESDFWNEISAALGVRTDAGEIQVVRQEVVIANPDAIPAFELLRQHGISIGIISDNTAFFYPYQAQILSLGHYTDPSLLFLSQEKQMRKSNGLFALAASSIDPASTLIVDDRTPNLEKAAAAGFQTLLYELGQSLTLKDAVSQSLPNTGFRGNPFIGLAKKVWSKVAPS